ncbi:MAG: alpha/beta hydrolase [Bacteroidota bacterium]
MDRGSTRFQGFRSDYVEACGVRQHALVAKGKGEGPTVALVHGLSAESTDLKNMFGFFRKRARRVIAPDLPGHGLSEIPEGGMRAGGMMDTFSEALAKRLDGPAVLLGNSLGGLAVIRFAHLYPDLVRALILIAPGGGQMSAPQLNAFKAQFPSPNRAEARQFIDLLLTRPPWYRGIVERIVMHRFARPHIRELIDHVKPEHLLRPEEVASLKVPTLLVWGGADHLQKGQFPFFRDHAPAHFKVEKPEGFSHCPFMDNAKRLNRLMAGYWEDLLQT